MTCPRTGKWIGGCRFEPRYDEPVLSDMERFEGRAGGFVPIAGKPGHVRFERPPLGQKTYIHDICTRCGKVVERTKGAWADGAVSAGQIFPQEVPLNQILGTLADATPKSPIVDGTQSKET